MLRGKGYEIESSFISVKPSLAKQGIEIQKLQGFEWTINYHSANKVEDLVVVRKDRFLFIPELSILEGFRKNNQSFSEYIKDLKHRIQW